MDDPLAAELAAMAAEDQRIALTESELDPARGAILVRHGKGNKRREVGMDQWGWEPLRPWLVYRVKMPVGPLFCVIDGRTRGRPLTTTSVRQQLRRTTAQVQPPSSDVVCGPMTDDSTSAAYARRDD